MKKLLTSRKLGKKALAILKELEVPQLSDIFTEKIYGIYQKIPEAQGKNLVLVPKEEDLLELKVNDGKTLFLLYKNDSEKSYIESTLKVCARDTSFKAWRAYSCADNLSKQGKLLQEVVNLFEHYKLNFPGSWRICADGISLLSEDNQVVLESNNYKTLEIISIISGAKPQTTSTAAPETEGKNFY